MKIAIIGSRSLVIHNLQPYIPPQTTELVSGGAVGVDSCVRAYAKEKGIPLTEFLPDYTRYKRAAPIKRNEQIIAYADEVVALWDGNSKGTRYSIDMCRRLGKKVTVYLTSKP